MKTLSIETKKIIESSVPISEKLKAEDFNIYAIQDFEWIGLNQEQIIEKHNFKTPCIIEIFEGKIIDCTFEKTTLVKILNDFKYVVFYGRGISPVGCRIYSENIKTKEVLKDAVKKFNSANQKKLNTLNTLFLNSITDV